MKASPITRSSAPSSLKWLWWWSLAHLAEAAVAIRSRLAGLPADRPPTTDLAAAGAGHSVPLSAKWPALAFAGLAAYGIGILLGLVLRSQII
ncbi:MAG: hypothetical protein ACRDG5_12135 [Anaerolineales bacterium]